MPTSIDNPYKYRQRVAILVLKEERLLIRAGKRAMLGLSRVEARRRLLNNVGMMRQGVLLLYMHADGGSAASDKFASSTFVFDGVHGACLRCCQGPINDTTLGESL